MEKIITRSEAETRAAAEKLAARLKGGDVIALYGELGAGKTAFVKGIADYFHTRDTVSSPTFTVVNEYEGDITVYHFDAYRLENVSVDECDWIDDYLFGDGICIIEWAENIDAVLPDDCLKITITKDPCHGADYREITVC